MMRAPNTAFATVTCLFFAWGFVTSNNDPLIAALRAIYALNYTEALLTQFAFFLAYGLVSLPAAAVLDRIGSIATILGGLLLMLGACLLVLVASAFQTYVLVLAALFLLASGITALQVAANPLAATLGDPTRSHFRLSLAQAFNSLGVVLGVHVGSKLMLSGAVFEGGASLDPTGRASALAAVDRAFLVIASFLVALILLIWSQRRRIAAAAPASHGGSPLSALKSGWASAGALAIFLYVGAEVTIGSVMINFLNQPEVLGLSLATSGWYLGWIYWFGALVGRFIGSALLTRLPAAPMLAGAALIAALLSATALLVGGPIGAWAALAVGFFNAIMFPTIFTLTLERSSAPAPAASGLLCTAIVGGALLPLLAGFIADASGYVASAFLVPALAYLGIVAFAYAANRQGRSPDAVVAGASR